MSLSAAIPRLRGSPLLGNLVEFRRHRLRMQRRIVDECGDLAVVRLGYVNVLGVSSVELAQEILVEKADAFTKTRGLRIARLFLGDGLLTSEHEVHRRQRKLMAPTFAPRRIAAFARTMVELSEHAAEQLPDGETVDVSEAMMRLTLAIVGQTLFSADVTGDARDVGDAVSLGIRYINRWIASPIILPIGVPTPSNLALRRAMARLDEIMYRMIREHRDGRDRGDMLSTLLAARDDSGAAGMTDLQVRDEAMTVFLAGHETTANALSWALYVLAQHPAVYAGLEDEVDRVLAGRSPTFEDLPHLPFAAQVFKETLRMYPPAYIVGREAERDVQIGGHAIAAGTIVFVNIYGIHHRGDYFAQPERFFPQRFSPEHETEARPGAFLPFGGGPRVCIGNHFALMEGQLALATLVQRARFTLRPNQPRVEAEPLVTLRPKNGMPMIVHHRSRRAAAA